MDESSAGLPPSEDSMWALVEGGKWITADATAVYRGESPPLPRARFYLPFFREGENDPPPATASVWIHVPLRDGWGAQAQFRLERQGEPVIAELRVIPVEDPPVKPAEWSDEALASKAPIPPRGLSSRMLREIPIESLLDMARAVFRGPTIPSDVGMSAAWTDEQVAEARSRRSGRRGLDLMEYARVAALYVEGLEADPYQPARFVEQRLQYSRSRVKHMVTEARNRGLLTPTSPGRPGGQLTDYGRSLVEELKRAPRND